MDGFTQISPVQTEQSESDRDNVRFSCWYRPGNRAAMPMSRIVLQAPSGYAQGQADNVHNEANELTRIRDYLFNQLATKTGQPIEKIYKDLKWPKRFTADEALEYGLIDRIARRKDASSDGVANTS